MGAKKLELETDEAHMGRGHWRRWVRTLPVRRGFMVMRLVEDTGYISGDDIIEDGGGGGDTVLSDTTLDTIVSD